MGVDIVGVGVHGHHKLYNGIALKHVNGSHIECNAVYWTKSTSILVAQLGPWEPIESVRFSDDNYIQYNNVTGTLDDDTGDGVGVAGDRNKIVGNLVHEIPRSNAIMAWVSTLPASSAIMSSQAELVWDSTDVLEHRTPTVRIRVAISLTAAG